MKREEQGTVRPVEYNMQVKSGRTVGNYIVSVCLGV